MSQQKADRQGKAEQVFDAMRRKRRITVVHNSYGCDSGCCGHTITLEEEGLLRDSGFVFGHPSGLADTPDFVRRLVIERYGDDHCRDIDWDHCVISED